MENGDKVFFGQLFSEVELFAKDHPFVESHLISFLRKILEKSFVVVCLLTDALKSLFKIFVVEYSLSVCLFINDKHRGALNLVLFLSLFE